MNTVCNCLHDAGSDDALSTFVINVLVHIYQKDKIAPEVAGKVASVNGPLRLRVHGRISLRFQTLTVSVTVSHFFMPESCERNP